MRKNKFEVRFTKNGCDQVVIIKAKDIISAKEKFNKKYGYCIIRKFSEIF